MPEFKPSALSLALTYLRSEACWTKTRLAKALGHGWWAFMRTYVVKLGFLDGRLGLALAISNAEGTYYRYMKLWLLQRQGALRPE